MHEKPIPAKFIRLAKKIFKKYRHNIVVSDHPAKFDCSDCDANLGVYFDNTVSLIYIDTESYNEVAIIQKVKYTFIDRAVCERLRCML